MPWPTDHLPEKIPPTVLEQVMVDALNTLKAWRDSAPGTPYPRELDEKVEVALLTYEARRKA